MADDSNTNTNNTKPEQINTNGDRIEAPVFDCYSTVARFLSQPSTSSVTVAPYQVRTQIPKQQIPIVVDPTPTWFSIKFQELKDVINFEVIKIMELLG